MIFSEKKTKQVWKGAETKQEKGEKEVSSFSQQVRRNLPVPHSHESDPFHVGKAFRPWLCSSHGSFGGCTWVVVMEAAASRSNVTQTLPSVSACVSISRGSPSLISRDPSWASAFLQSDIRQEVFVGLSAKNLKLALSGGQKRAYMIRGFAPITPRTRPSQMENPYYLSLRFTGHKSPPLGCLSVYSGSDLEHEWQIILSLPTLEWIRGETFKNKTQEVYVLKGRWGL